MTSLCRAAPWHLRITWRGCRRCITMIVVDAACCDAGWCFWVLYVLQDTIHGWSALFIPSADQRAFRINDSWWRLAGCAWQNRYLKRPANCNFNRWALVTPTWLSPTAVLAFVLPSPKDREPAGGDGVTDRWFSQYTPSLHVTAYAVTAVYRCTWADASRGAVGARKTSGMGPGARPGTYGYCLGTAIRVDLEISRCLYEPVSCLRGRPGFFFLINVAETHYAMK